MKNSNFDIFQLSKDLPVEILKVLDKFLEKNKNDDFLQTLTSLPFYQDFIKSKRIPFHKEDPIQNKFLLDEVKNLNLLEKSKRKKKKKKKKKKKVL